MEPQVSRGSFGLVEEIVFKPVNVDRSRSGEGVSITKGRIREVNYSELLEQGKCLISVLDRRGSKFVAYVIKSRNDVPKKYQLSSKPRGVIIYYNMDVGRYFLVDSR